MFNPSELNQLAVVVESARREGWIAADATLEPELVNATVVVTLTSASDVAQFTYPHDARWPFQLLRDLAWRTD